MLYRPAVYPVGQPVYNYVKLFLWFVISLVFLSYDLTKILK